MPYHFDFFTRELRTFHRCRQHKDRASQNEQTVETLGSHLEETVRFSFVVQDFVSQLLTSPSFSPSPLPPSPSLLQTLELEQLRTKLTKSTRENFRHEAEIGTLSAYVNLSSPLSMCTSVQSAVLHQVQSSITVGPRAKHSCNYIYCHNVVHLSPELRDCVLMVFPLPCAQEDERVGASTCPSQDHESGTHQLCTRCLLHSFVWGTDH